MPLFPYTIPHRPVTKTDRHMQDEDEDETRSFLHHSSIQQHAMRRQTRKLIILTLVNATMLILTGGLFVTLLHAEFFVRNADLRRVSSYSPVHNLVDLDMGLVTANGTLFPPKHPAIGRQMPNDAADLLWADWELTRVLPVTRSDILRMGKDPSTVAKLDDVTWGLGDDAYVATFDVYHQLHCLNTLRHIAYGSYYSKSGVNATGTSMNEIHVNHCVDMLVQALQCSGNVNLITMHWVETQTYPYPDMSVNRKCINFDKLTQWRRENTIDMDKYVKVMQKPDGVKQRPAPDALYEFHGLDSPNHQGGANPGEDFNF